MLRKDPKACFLQEDRREGPLFRKRWVPYFRFVTGNYRSRVLLSQEEFASMCRQDAPVAVLRAEDTRRVWWLFQGQCYWEDEGYSQREVHALLLERLMLKDKRVQRALDRVAVGQLDVSPGRKPIPDDVKTAVWRRDGGRCVKCGSQRNLEYDHIIPFSMGGSDTVRNLQLLCETCNRSKGGSLT